MEINCDKCGFKHYDFEKCLKIFYVKHEYYGDKWYKIGAGSFAGAAEKAAIEIDGEEFDLGEIVNRIEIANSDKSIIKYFSVNAETEIVYHVNEI